MCVFSKFLMSDYSHSSSTERTIRETGYSATNIEVSRYKRTSKSPSFPELEPKAKASHLSDTLLDHFVPRLSKEQQIGIEGGFIKVGGCFVTFQPRTFHESTKVKVIAEVDSSQRPERSEAITPTLVINVHKELLLEATVRLSSWVIPEHPYQMTMVQIWRSSQDDSKVEVIHQMPLGNSRFIQFKCKRFSKMWATLAGLFSIPVSFPFQPSVFISGKSFVPALHLEDEVISKSFSNEMKKQLSRDMEAEHLTFNSVLCKINDKVEGQISCIQPEDGFEFKPSKQFSVDVNRYLLSGGQFYRRLMLVSESDEKEILVQFEMGKKGYLTPNAFPYNWKPVGNIQTTSAGSVSSKSLCDSPSEEDKTEPSLELVPVTSQIDETPASTNPDYPRAALASHMSPSSISVNNTFIYGKADIRVDRRNISAMSVIEKGQASIALKDSTTNSSALSCPPKAQSRSSDVE